MTDPRDIIVIGASLGGLEGLCRVTSGLPADLSAALLIVLHTGPSSPRMLAEIVGRFSLLPVSYARQGEAVIPGHVYFAPPDLHLTVIAPGILVLREGAKVHFSRSAADVLFHSAASVFGSRVIGVVMTGGDADGAEGLRMIKAAGGLCVVQHPATATNPEMPFNALLTVRPDYVVPLDEMAALLTRLVEGDGL
jgi:two-component system chemotaxis response regulator CheB